MASKAQMDNPTREEKTSYERYRDGETTPQVMLTIALVLAARRWRSLLDEKLRPMNQSAARMEALGAIMSSPPLSPQVEIARRLRIEGPTLTRMLDSLESDGLVLRVPDPADRRTKQLKLTGPGEHALEEVFNAADEMRQRLLESFSPEQIDQMNVLLWELVRRLDSRLPDGSF